jgi:hypothetical protein
MEADRQRGARRTARNKVSRPVKPVIFGPPMGWLRRLLSEGARSVAPLHPGFCGQYCDRIAAAGLFEVTGCDVKRSHSSTVSCSSRFLLFRVLAPIAFGLDYEMQEASTEPV